eukprot:2865740-Rhodomonas_salina.1
MTDMYWHADRSVSFFAGAAAVYGAALAHIGAVRLFSEAMLTFRVLVVQQCGQGVPVLRLQGGDG